MSTGGDAAIFAFLLSLEGTADEAAGGTAAAAAAEGGRGEAEDEATAVEDEEALEDEEAVEDEETIEEEEAGMHFSMLGQRKIQTSLTMSSLR